MIMRLIHLQNTRMCLEGASNIITEEVNLQELSKGLQSRIYVQQCPSKKRASVAVATDAQSPNINDNKRGLRWLSSLMESLSSERLQFPPGACDLSPTTNPLTFVLTRFREMTLICPTWAMSRCLLYVVWCLCALVTLLCARPFAIGKP